MASLYLGHILTVSGTKVPLYGYDRAAIGISLGWPLQVTFWQKPRETSPWGTLGKDGMHRVPEPAETFQVIWPAPIILQKRSLKAGGKEVISLRSPCNMLAELGTELRSLHFWSLKACSIFNHQWKNQVQTNALPSPVLALVGFSP